MAKTLLLFLTRNMRNEKLRKGISQRVLLSWLKTATFLHIPTYIMRVHIAFNPLEVFYHFSLVLLTVFQDAKILKVIYIERMEFRQLKEYNS